MANSIIIYFTGEENFLSIRKRTIYNRFLTNKNKLTLFHITNINHRIKADLLKFKNNVKKNFEVLPIPTGKKGIVYDLDSEKLSVKAKNVLNS